MIQSKVDSRFLGSVKQSFFVFPDIPKSVQHFLWGLAAFIACYYVVLLWNKFKVFSFFKGLVSGAFSSSTRTTKKTKKAEKKSVSSSSGKEVNNGGMKVSSDQEVLDWLVMTKASFDVSVERAGQRTLAAVVEVTGLDGLDVFVVIKDAITDSLITPGAKVKCIFAELQKGEKKVNAFVGTIKSLSENGGMAITRKSAFGFIRRRAFSRRKVADQRFIKVKVWRLDDDDFDVDFILDNIEPEIFIDNKKDVAANSKSEQILDISKGGLALLGTIRDGGSMMSRNDKLLLCMLIYQPKRKTFDPHLIFCEARAANSAGEGLIRLSFQFLRSLKIPPRKRSTLFKGQAVMAMNLAQSAKGKK
ncbi:hypothetical protein [Maridesulfovibrio frigidus]|uniref:hypothetical protein n=1 Tax=Maridesulfovibrio frigidus TaxID=340956 RepID=UPI0004E25863|nr:hypothetical protein [Maridesulfovibrio frigidus]